MLFTTTKKIMIKMFINNYISTKIYNLRAVETVEEGNDELLVDPVVFVRCEVALVMERVTP